ncbi:vWA domain-containing protein [Micromonospora sp. NBC_01813]|uniref:vWA domain-containing protein n=1 Tax=Micromonospora sp. NBC_01813 TaxID=2975988 RepID=UPI002DD9596F|nr:VWA domain-containing protein [Micromonospora sp. NBC_01813]WSA07527.1 VWA domain-containing protein [Micromonospora sp. NBC_01813]
MTADPLAPLATGYPLAPLVSFAEALRTVGLAVDIDRVTAAAAALGHWGVAAGAQPYWPLRVALCRDRTDVPLFDQVYREWFGAPPDDAGHTGPTLVPAQSRPADGRPGTATPVPRDTGASVPRNAGASASRDAGGGAGNASRLASRDFDDLTEDELREVATWVDLLRPMPTRRTMHHRSTRTGRIDPARTMRLMLRTGGELVRLRHRRPAVRTRRLLLLVDVSASMSPYSDMLLRFAAAALAANPRTTEIFAVGTDHTRLTRSMRGLRPRDALPAAGRVRTGWSGGTTLGDALNGFLRRWGGTDVVRSAIVIIGSDGLEHSDPTPMVRQVQRLAALAKVLIWASPDCHTDGEHSRDAHIADAQASAARVVGCHDYQALRRLAKVVTDA